MLHPDEHDDTAGLPFAGLAIIAAAIAVPLGGVLVFDFMGIF